MDTSSEPTTKRLKLSQSNSKSKRKNVEENEAENYKSDVNLKSEQLTLKDSRIRMTHTDFTIDLNNPIKDRLVPNFKNDCIDDLLLITEGLLGSQDSLS